MATTNTPDSEITKQAEQAVAQVAGQAQQAAQQFAGTVQDITKDPTKVVGMVGDQMKNLGQAVGAQELIDEGKDIVNEMGGFVLHTLKVAFFLTAQQRVSRGEFLVGLLASTVVMSVVSALLPILLGAGGVALMTILILIPIFNLGVKRFHDLNKPGRWSLMLFVPIVGWVMPLLFKGDNTNNPYGPDPVEKTPHDLQSYMIVVLGLLFVSTLLVTILSWIGISVSNAPSTDDINNIDDPNAITDQTQLPNDNNNVRGF